MDDFTDSDQEWFDRLGGQANPPKSDAARREADALRRALELERGDLDPEIEAATTEEAREQRWQRLRFRLRRAEKLNLERSRRWWPVAAVAAVLGLSVLLLPTLTGDGTVYDEPPQMRGELNVVRRQDAKPRVAAEALAANWRAAGLSPRLYQSGKVFAIDVDIDADTPPAAQEALRREGLALRTGIGRVEFAPR